jgi:hypothetical protein
MNESEFDRTARAWLDDGPTRMSDRGLLSALEEIHTTRQRRAWWPAWRATPVNIYARAAIAAVLVVGVGLAAINFLPRGGGSGAGGLPSPSPTPTPTPTPIASASPSPAPAVAIPELTQTFVSSLNGFSIGYPENARLTQATVIWVPAAAQDDGRYDFVTDTITIRGGSVKAPDGVTVDDAWMDDVFLGIQPGGCANPSSSLPEITIDGQPARISTSCPGEVTGTVVAGGRAYEFTMWSDARNLREVFDAYAATIHLRPEDAKNPASPSPTPS